MTLTPCDRCPAHCCREPAVDLTVPEVHRLSEALHLDASDFTEMPWMETAERARRIVRSPAKNRYHRLRLKRVQDGEGRRCVFLHPLTPDRSVCSVYGIRPETCRTYPTYLGDGGVVRSGGGRFCPPGVWTLDAMDLRRLRADWIFRRRLGAIHDGLVDGWNERVFFDGGSFSESSFHAFSMAACREIEALEPGVFLRPEPGQALDDPEWPEARTTALVDQALRGLGWRTDRTAACARPDLGRESG